MNAFTVVKTALLFLILLTQTHVKAAEEIPSRFMHGLNNPRYDYVRSAALERGFHVYVRLPDGYSSADKHYPVVYLLDGGATFPALAGYYNYLSLANDVPDIIIVGISYGAATFEGGNMRSTDFTAAAAERSFWGGAPQFQSFLKKELMPRLEAQYRIDTTRRIIMGQSLGGQFVLFTALTEPDLFWGHIASNPALHRNMAFFRDHAIITPKHESKLFVSLAEHDDPQFREPALAWVSTWQTKDHKPWQMLVKNQPGHNHFSALTTAFRDGLMWLFSEK